MGTETWWHIATVVALCLALAEGIVVLGLARTVAPLMGRRPMVPGVEVGTAIAPIILPRADTSVEEPLTGSTVDHVVLFVSPDCSACKALVPTVQPTVEQGDRRWEVVVVVGGSRERTEDYAKPFIDRGVRAMLDIHGTAEESFATHHTYPLGFAVRVDGIVSARGIAGSWERVQELVAESNEYGKSAHSKVAGNGAVADRSASVER